MQKNPGTRAQERQFQRHPFRAVLGSRQLVEYVVLDAEPSGPATARFALADVQVITLPSPWCVRPSPWCVRDEVGRRLPDCPCVA